MEIRFSSAHTHALRVQLLPVANGEDKKAPKAGQLKLSHGVTPPQAVAVLPETPSRYELIKLAAKAVALCRKEGFATVSFDLGALAGHDALADLVYSIGYAVHLADYAFDRYLSEKKDDHVTQAAILGVGGSELEAALAEGAAVGRAVCFARDLANERSHVMTPLALAEEAKKVVGAQLEVLTLRDMETHKMGGMLSVSQGAHHPPAFIILRYTGDPGCDKRVGIVGKGLTYDSGGLSLKPGNSMINMHNDMSGAAATIAAMQAIAGRGLKANVTAVVPACENMLANYAYRPGDIITQMSGKTVLIKSTDAEGRLVIADALTWLCQKENVSCLVDIATLTGAAAAACGPLVTAAAMAGGFCESALDGAACNAGNMTLKMPLPQDYMKYITDSQADLVNSTGGPVGMIGAALFLQAFTEKKPWLHLDIAGSSHADPGTDLNPAGCTGNGTALLYHLVRQLADC